jgi:hypothetical protein
MNNLEGEKWRKMNPPSDSMRKYYESLFKRNQMKFIRRSNLGPEHLGSEFSYEGVNYKLIGTATQYEMILENLFDGSCYMVHCDFVTKMVLN